MQTNRILSSQQMEQLKADLLARRSALLSDIDSQAESLREEVNPSGELSNAPLHLGDAAPSQLDVHVSLMERDQDTLYLIQEAIERLSDASFGTCKSCHKPIDFARLEQIPYAAYCVRCMENKEHLERRLTGRDTNMVRLTGFEAIEFAEKEGLTLSKAGDSIDESAMDLTIAEAEAIAVDRPELIFLEVAAADLYVHRNMKPGR